MDVTPSLLVERPCIQDGQLVRFFGRTSQGADKSLRIEDLLRQDNFVLVNLGGDCPMPEVAALVRVTGSWTRNGPIEAYEISVVEDAETLYSLQSQKRLRLLEFQASSAYKIARTRVQQHNLHRQ